MFGFFVTIDGLVGCVKHVADIYSDLAEYVATKDFSDVKLTLLNSESESNILKSAYWEFLRCVYLEASETMFDETELGFIDDACKTRRITPLLCKLLVDAVQCFTLANIQMEDGRKYLTKFLLQFLSAFIERFGMTQADDEELNV